MQDKTINFGYKGKITDPIKVATHYKDAYKNGVWQNPYTSQQAIAFAAPILHHNKLQFNVLLPDNLLLSNTKNNIKQIAVNFNDGGGYKPLTYNKTTAVNYRKNGTYTWVFKITLTNGKVLYSHTQIHIDAPTSRATQNIEVFNALAPSNGARNPFPIEDAIVRVRYAPGHNNRIMRPFIVAEGFDPGSIVTPEKDGGDISLTGRNGFLSSLDNSGNLEPLLTGTTQDYDLIYIDWRNGTQSIQDNSKTLEAVIRWVNQQKAANSSPHPNILLGQSMGGLVGRYTLVKMEEKGLDHDVSIFAAHDSPMQGANSPLSMQYFSRHAQQQYTASPIMYTMGQIIIPTINSLAKLMGIELFKKIFPDGYPSPIEVLTINDTPAALQMNYYHVNNRGQANSAVHDAWQQEFDALGYPTETLRNIAISNGSECAIDNGFAPREKLMQIHHLHDPGIIGDLIHMLASPLIGIIAAKPSIYFLGRLPGASKYYFDFDMHSNPSLNDNNRLVYQGRIRYEKKLLWLFPIKNDVTNRVKHAPSNYMPFATYTGGTININSIIPDVISSSLPPNSIVNPIFGFIPTVSSIDIRRNNGQTTPNDYMRNYAGGTTPEAALTSGFNNFIVDFQRNGAANRPHISFQPRNGNWLAAELDSGAPALVDCTDFCSDNQIQGNNAICNVETYTFNSRLLPRWTITENPGLVNMVVNGNSVTLQKVAPNSTGFITLTAEINNTDCGTYTVTKRIPIRNTPLYYLDKKIDCNYPNHIKLELKPHGLSFADQGITSINWRVVSTSGGCNAFLSRTGNMARVSGDCSYWSMIIEITATNNCGTRISRHRVEPYPEYCSNYNLIVSKTKANETILKVTTQNASSSLSKNKEQQFNIKILNMYGEHVYAKQQHNKTFNVGKLKHGIYIIKLMVDNKTYLTKKIVIE